MFFSFIPDFFKAKVNNIENILGTFNDTIFEFARYLALIPDTIKNSGALESGKEAGGSFYKWLNK